MPVINNLFSVELYISFTLSVVCAYTIVHRELQAALGHVR